MARVFDNLLNNACHYAYPASLIRVEGRLAQGQAVLTFTNAGATIPPEKLSRMFERFFRLDPSRGTRTGNAGLGLAIAKGIAENHNGHLEFSRSQGGGLAVTLVLILSNDEDCAYDEEPSA